MLRFLRRLIGAVIVFGTIGVVLWYTWWLWAILVAAVAMIVVFVIGCWMLTAE